MASTSQATANLIDDEEVYEVEKILDVRTTGSTKEYLVRWNGWDPKFDSWEPETNLLTCHDLIEKFDQNQASAAVVDIGTKEKSAVEKSKKINPKSPSVQGYRRGNDVESKTSTGEENEKSIPDADQSISKGAIDRPIDNQSISNQATTIDNAEIDKSNSSEPTSTSTSNSTSNSQGGKRPRQRKQQKFWQMVTEEEAASLRDPFWKNLEEGKIDFGGDGLYERVKRGRGNQINENTVVRKTRSKKTNGEKRIGKKTKENVDATETENIEDQNTARGEIGDSSVTSSEIGQIDNVIEKVKNNYSSDGDIQKNVAEAVTSTEIDSTVPDSSEKLEVVGEIISDDIDANAAVSTTDVAENISNIENPESNFNFENTDTKKIVESTDTGTTTIIDVVVEEEEEEEKEETHPALEAAKSKVDEIVSTCEQLAKEASALLDSANSDFSPTSAGHQSNKDISPINVTPKFTTGGQWRPMTRDKISPRSDESKLVIAETTEPQPIDQSPVNILSIDQQNRNRSIAPPLSQQATTSTDTGSSIISPGPFSTPSELTTPSTETAASSNEIWLPDLPLPMSMDLSLSDFFKSELRLSQNENVQQTISNRYEFEHACLKGDVERVRQSLTALKKSYSSSLIDLNARNPPSGNTILMQICLLACDPAHQLDDMIDILVSNGANINARNDSGDTALTMAINRNQVCKVTKLLSLGAAINLPNFSGETPLMVACKKNSVNVVYRLLEYGADFNAQSADGKTAIDIAAETSSGGGGVGCENALRNRADKVMQTFDRELLKVLPPEDFSIIRHLFPLHCYALNESNAFRIVFNHDDQPTMPGKEARMVYAIAIAKARCMSLHQIEVRFWGTTPVKTVLLNDIEQVPLTSEGRFIYSMWPIKQGLNDLVIKCNADCKLSLQKLLINAFAVRILGM